MPLEGDPSLPFRRRVVLTRPEFGTVTASVEDHIHHFEVRVDHVGGRVTGIAGRAVRSPWSMCPGAVAVLQEFVGRSLTEASAADPSAHCTHLLDLARMAVRFAATDEPGRRYELTVTGWDQTTRSAEARRNDGRMLRWIVDGRTIVEPARYGCPDIGAGFGEWATDTLDADEAEVALLLRRAVWMSPSRGFDLDEYERLSDIPIGRGSCFASQPHRIDVAVRNRGSSLPQLTEG